MYQVFLSRQAQRTLEKVAPRLELRLKKRLMEICDKPFEGKRLHGQFEGLMSVRVGEWRIVYEVDTENLLVVVHGIGPRGQIYKD